MIKIAVATALPLAIGFVVFPQFRVAISGLAPFALFALCPLSMIIGMGSMKDGKQDGQCSSCGENHASAKHVEPETINK